MKTPAWMHAAFAEHTEDGIERRAIVRTVAAKLLANDAPLARRLAETYVRTEYGRWTRQQEAAAGLTDDSGQLVMAFPDLPAHLEIAPGRFAHQGVMTGADWDHALRQAETKATNASGFAGAVRAAYDRIRPLLDGELTTADVAGRIGADEPAAAGAR